MTSRLRPSLPALAFLTWILIGAFGFGNRFLNGDGDVARHLRHGETILAKGDVIRHDPFSFTRPGAPFVSFEYGAQVLLALVHRLAGLAGVVALAASLAALAVAISLRFMLRRGVEPAAAYLASAVGAILLATHWIARPHLFTFVLLALLLERLARPRPPSPLLLFSLFVVWANLHAGWLFGLALLSAWMLGRIVEAWRARDANMRTELRAAILGLSASIVALLVTPYGVRMPSWFLIHLADPINRRLTDEFRPPDFTDAGSIIFLTVTVAASWALVKRRTRLPLPHLLAILGFTFGGLVARRNIPIAAITALPLAMLHLDPLLRRLPAPRTMRPAFAQAASGTWWPAVIGAAGVWLTAIVARLDGPVLLPNAFDPKVFPVAALEALRASGRTPRLLNAFTWGGYVEWAAPPGQRVFIDPGSDFFGGKLMLAYLRAVYAEPGWRDVLATYGVDGALLPPGAPLIAALKREPGWTVAHVDSTAVLLIRSPAPAAKP